AEGRVTLAGREVRLLGIDPLTAPPGLLLPAMAPGAGGATDGPPPLFAAPDLATAIGALPAPGMTAGVVVTDISHPAELLGTLSPTRLLLLPDQPLRQTPLGAIGPYALRSPQSTADLSQLSASCHLNITASGLIAFAVGLFVVLGTIGLAF